MAYTILNSNGTVLTTIQDGTINTTSTSLGLPGRNYAGYGQAIDTNFVQMLENFASTTPPSNPIQGQLWFNTNNNTLYVCPVTGTTIASNWLSLTSTSSGGNTTFGSVVVTGNLQAANANLGTAMTANAATLSYLTVTANTSLANLTSTVANVGTLTTTAITTGNAQTSGTLTGVWNISGGAGGAGATALNFVSGGIQLPAGGTYGIKCDNYMYANGASISFAGNYSNTNVASYMAVYSGNVGNALSTGNTAFNGTTLSTGANTTAGSITGNWTLTAGSRLQATYADLAERFAADDIYEPGTVVQLGGEAEITAVQYELAEDVFGVISDTAAYLMNAGAGSDATHPPVAVSGRVQVKVSGVVLKGQRLVSAGSGIARAASEGEATPFNVIGRALENKLNDGLGFVLAFVSIK